MRDLIASITLLVMSINLGWCTRPHRARCTRGFYAEGVSMDGKTTCRQSPPLAWPDERYFPAETYPMQIYCTGGSRPIVVDHRTVGCQR